MGNEKKRNKTIKKILNAGKGELPTYQPDTKAIFDYEVLLPTVDVNAEGFPENRYRSFKRANALTLESLISPLIARKSNGRTGTENLWN